MRSVAVARRIERIWYGDSLLALPLLPLSWLFGLLVGLRRRLYRAGWLRCERVAAPVIVVGNLTVGGTGKTPLAAWLARRLLAEGRSPGIVSRGYGAPHRGAPLLVTAETAVDDAGDEPLVLARRARVPVAVCRNRAAAARLLAAQGVDVIIADDGLQHYALARDLEIVVVDGLRRFGNGRLLPAGPLREPVSRLADMALVAVNGAEAGPGEIAFALQTGRAVALDRRERRDLSVFSGQKVWALAGVGNPQRFLDALRERGIDPVAVDVPDHGRIDLADLRTRADWPILMTEKDAVKYPRCRDTAAWYLPVEVTMSVEAEAMLMSRVRAVLAHG
jgi:tetraacyldisaccharide 4'-kinase